MTANPYKEDNRHGNSFTNSATMRHETWIDYDKFLQNDIQVTVVDGQGNPITDATINYATVDASMTNQGTQGSVNFDSEQGYYLVPTDAGKFAQLIEVVAPGYEPMLTTMYLWNYDYNSLWNYGKPRRHTIVLHQNENQLKNLTLETPRRDGKFKDRKSVV